MTVHILQNILRASFILLIIVFICRWEGYATSLTKLEYGQLTVEASAPETEKWPLHVKIVLPIKAETEAVWKVLTEYDQMKEFVPHMTKCRVIEQQGNTFNVEQVYKHLLISMKLLLSIKHNHPNRIDFHLVGGNMKVYDGHWSIEPYNPGGTLLSLEVDVQPGFFAPRGIVSWILKKELPEGVMAVAEKAIKDSGKTPSPKKEEKIP